jgi:hypothetical protein
VLRISTRAGLLIPRKALNVMAHVGYLKGVSRWISNSALALIAACSSPYQFSDQISRFSGAVENVSTAYNSGYDALISDKQNYNDLLFRDKRVRLTLSPGCTPSGHNVGLPCDIKDVSGPEPSRLDLAESHSTTAQSLQLLTEYVHALQAVTDASDRSRLDQAASQLSSSVSSLIAKVPAPGAALAAPIVGAGFNAFAWLIGQELDRERFITLERDTKMASAPISTLASALGLQLDAIAAERSEILFRTGNQYLKTSGGTREASGRQTQRALTAILDTRPSDTTKALIAAHQELITAIEDPSKNFGNFVSAVSHFSELAKALRDAMVPASS